MTFYICDRKKDDCKNFHNDIGCINDYCKYTSDINHRKSKEYPITFKIVETFIPGKASLWEVPYGGTETIDNPIKDTIVYPGLEPIAPNRVAYNYIKNHRIYDKR